MQINLTLIGIALATMFFGYFFGLFEGRGQGYKKRKKEEGEEFKSTLPTMQAASPVVKDDPGILRLKEENFRIELDVQRYSEKYLQSNFKDGEIAGGRIQYVRLFTIVAVFILLIACINFMNLTTARSIKRAKEIGIRKVVGAFRSATGGQSFIMQCHCHRCGHGRFGRRPLAA